VAKSAASNYFGNYFGASVLEWQFLWPICGECIHHSIRFSKESRPGDDRDRILEAMGFKALVHSLHQMLFWATVLPIITPLEPRLPVCRESMIPHFFFASFVVGERIRRTRRLRFIAEYYKNHSAVRSLFFRPSFKQGRNRPPIIGNQR